MDEATQKPTVECRPVSLETPCAHDRFSKYTSSHRITFASFLGLCLPCPQTARFCPVKQPSFKKKAAVVEEMLRTRYGERGWSFHAWGTSLPESSHVPQPRSSLNPHPFGFYGGFITQARLIKLLAIGLNPLPSGAVGGWD